MGQEFRSYLELLDELLGSLDRLSELARQKADAVRRDNLLDLDEVLKQEQAISLSLRGYEQKRLKLAAGLRLENVPLSALAAHSPADLQARAAQTAGALQQSYAAYRQESERARQVLESNLRDLDKAIGQMGGPQSESGAGYAPPNAEPPQKMKTDFRA